MSDYAQGSRFTLHHGDSREVLKTLAESSVDSIVCDPPYHLTTGKKGGSGEASVNLESPYGRARIGTGFMGMTWDGGDVAHDVSLWAECLRVAKPGAFLLAFGGTRTYHRLACAIEDAGWELRDSILRGHVHQPDDCPWLMAWSFGSGFPKSHNGEWGGTALKPAWEPIVCARKPLIGTVEANWREHGTGALNIDGCRVGDTVETWPASRSFQAGIGKGFTSGLGAGETQSAGDAPPGRWPANLILDGSDDVVACFPFTASGTGAVKRASSRDDAGNTGAAYGAESRPAGTPMICHSDDSSAARFFYCAKASQEDRNEGLNGHETVIIEWSSTLESPQWDDADHKVKLQVDTAASQKKVIAVSGASSKSASEWSTLLFGSGRTAPCLLDTTCIIETTTSSITSLTTLSYFQNLLTSGSTRAANSGTGSGGSPARTAEPGTLLLRTTSAAMASALGVEPAASPMLLKISVSERRSDHPTVKPTDLMRYLCRLVTPKGGTVLDPFMGSGSTGKAAMLEGLNFIGVDLSAEYIEIARARIDFALRQGHQPSLLEAA